MTALGQTAKFLEPSLLPRSIRDSAREPARLRLDRARDIVGALLARRITEELLAAENRD